MGEVYSARDTKLGRDVAIKVLPEEFTQNEERLARFEREARLLAALNHPGIATLYGVEEFETKPFLVMELVDGETLAERIARGPLPVDEAMTLSQQIAEALEAAHEKGVIHRDLKPANIKVNPEGQVKVLDFGLAKAFTEETPDSDSSFSPTLSRDSTRAGVILGTAAYMSPEQAKGKAVDKRSDIFSFGIVLYEMLTGRKAFGGDEVSDVLASIIKMEPDWTAVSDLDPRVQNLLRRCLRKDRKNRLQAIGDVRVEIQEILAEPDVVAPSERAKPRANMLWQGIAGVLTITLLATLWALWPTASAPEPPVRFSVNLGADDVQLWTGPGGAPTLSSDGKMLAFVGQMPGGNRQLYIRSLDSLEPTPLSGTENARVSFFSPDGRWLAFFTSDALKKVSVVGGAALTIADAQNTHGGTWGPDDTIVYASRTGLYRVPASGGAPVELTTLSEGESSHHWPWFLPNGEAVLFVVRTGGSFNDATLEAVLLETGERKVVHRGGTYPRYASSGHLLYAREATLFAMPFDADRIEPTGEPSPVIEGVGADPGDGRALFAVADDGTLVYGLGAAVERKLVWVDRQGVEQPAAGTLQQYIDPRLSPDGKRLAVFIQESNAYDIWLLELGRGTLTRLTFGGQNARPLWSPGGERVIFGSNRGGGVNFNIFSKPADGSGTAEQLTTGAYRIPTSISSDGKTIVFRQNSETTGRDIGMVRLEGESEPEMLLQTSFEEHTGMLSPNDRWLAYVSNDSGREEIFLRPFPGPGGKVQISTEGGTEPLWSRDGGEIFYRIGDKMMAVAISTEPQFAPGSPTLLFEGGDLSVVPGGNPGTGYDVARDGRFLMVRAEESSAAAMQINVVLNWFGELKRLVPTR